MSDKDIYAILFFIVLIIAFTAKYGIIFLGLVWIGIVIDDIGGKLIKEIKENKKDA